MKNRCVSRVTLSASAEERGPRRGRRPLLRIPLPYYLHLPEDLCDTRHERRPRDDHQRREIGRSLVLHSSQLYSRAKHSHILTKITTMKNLGMLTLVFLAASLLQKDRPPRTRCDAFSPPLSASRIIRHDPRHFRTFDESYRAIDIRLWSTNEGDEHNRMSIAR